MAVNIPSQLVVKKAAQWAVDTTVYSNKRMLLTSDVFYTGTDQPRFKFGNGVDTWSNLDYVPEGASSGGLSIVMSFFPPVRFNAVSGTSYYLTQWINSGGESLANAVVLAPADFTITACSIQSVSSVATTEGVTFNIIVNGTPNVLTSTYTMNGTQNQLTTGLSISVSAGDELVIEMASPTWVTAPSALRMSLNIYGS